MAISRLGVLLTLLLVGSVCIIVAAPQQKPAAPPAAGGVQANFTGAVRSVDASNVRAVRFQYDAGARSFWHSHEGSQVLLLEQGSGRMQIQGQRVQELVVGRPVVLPGGVAHWHGAAPDQGLTQIAVNVGGVKWMNAVSDQEYLADLKR
jgi:quercetin dioxygenase-like cupin family protein